MLPKEICNRGVACSLLKLHWIHEFYLDLIVTTSAFVKREILEDETSKKICETNGSQYIGPASVSRIFFRCLIFDFYNISICKKGKVKDNTSKKIRETDRSQITSKLSIDLFLESPKNWIRVAQTWILAYTVNLD
jgi:hypothetical protein